MFGPAEVSRLQHSTIFALTPAFWTGGPRVVPSACGPPGCGGGVWRLTASCSLLMPLRLSRVVRRGWAHFVHVAPCPSTIRHARIGLPSLYDTGRRAAGAA